MRVQALKISLPERYAGKRRQQPCRRAQANFGDIHIFSVKIILAALLLAVDLALTELAGIALGEGTRLHNIAKFLFQLALFGVAVIMVTVGAIMVSAETIKSGYKYLKGDPD